MEEDFVSSESDLLDGESWESPPELFEERSRSPSPVTIKASVSTFEKANYAGVRKYVAHVLPELTKEYPKATEKDLRAMATRRWHDLSEAERKSTHDVIFTLIIFLICRLEGQT